MESFCSEIGGEELRHAMIVDLSPLGLRLQRPLGGPRTRDLQLEFEIPGVDEIVWAHGRIGWDEVWRLPPTPGGGLSGVIRTSGVEIVGTASRHRRILREYVMDTWRSLEGPIDDGWLMQSSCYRFG